MSDLSQLAEQLAQLSEDDLSRVLDQAYDKRGAVARPDSPSGSALSRDQFAEWIAKRHLSIDRSIQDVYYLPSGAPAREIRLVEVNARLIVPDDFDAVQPVDFKPTVAGVDFALSVADVSPQQWDAIQRHELDLPPGWQLAGYRHFGRRRP